MIAVVLLGGIAHAIVLHRDLLAGLRIPLDGGIEVGGHRVFGDNKTVRGVLVMVGGCALAGAVVFSVAPPGPQRPAWGWALVGAALGSGYVAAELPNSFVKRRLAIAPGEEGHGATQRLVDQLDSVLGVTAVAWILLPLDVADVVLLVVLGTSIHLLFDRVLHRTGIKRRATLPTPPRA